MLSGGTVLNYPDLAKTHLVNGRKLRQGQKYNAATIVLQKAIQVHYNSTQTDAEFGWTLVDTGRYPEAVEKFRAAMVLDPRVH